MTDATEEPDDIEVSVRWTHTLYDLDGMPVSEQRGAWRGPLSEYEAGDAK